MQVLLDPLAVRLDARRAVLIERIGGGGEQIDRLQHRVSDHRQVDIELEVARAARHRHRHVVADDPGRHHGQRLRLGGVDLAGHDGGARLVGGDEDLADAAARAAREPAHVVGDLVERAGRGLERTRYRHQRLLAAHRGEAVGRLGERKAGTLGDRRRHLPRVGGSGVQPGADRGAPDRQLQDERQDGADRVFADAELIRVAGELLAEGERGRILEVGAPDLDDVVERLRLRLQGGAQLRHGGQQPLDDLHRDRDVDRARKDVVGRLRAIDMIVGVHAAVRAQRIPHPLRRPVGDHLVGVHVALGAAAGLPDHQREMLVQAPVDDLLRGVPDRFGHVAGEIAQLSIDRGRALLDEAQRPDQGPRQALGADLEVLERALGLRSPVPVRRHLDLAHAVPLDARAHGLPLPPAIVMTYGKRPDEAPDRDSGNIRSIS